MTLFKGKKHYEPYERKFKKITRLSKLMARKEPGSNNRKKIAQKLAKHFIESPEVCVNSKRLLHRAIVKEVMQEMEEMRKDFT